MVIWHLCVPKDFRVEMTQGKLAPLYSLHLHSIQFFYWEFTDVTIFPSIISHFFQATFSSSSFKLELGFVMWMENIFKRGNHEMWMDTQ